VITLATVSFMRAGAPAAPAVQPQVGDSANYQYRLGEIAQMAPRFDVQYEYRLGEIAQVAARFEPQYVFRRGEWFGNSCYLDALLRSLLLQKRHVSLRQVSLAQALLYITDNRVLPA
jgi:hypothetical protein